MHVTRVELENIKSYGEGERRGDFHFERGTTAIVGPNGAGKTTILEAIAWALFDVLDYSKDDFLRRGAKRGSVRVTFHSDLDERRYTIYRDTGTGYYVYDPELRMKIATGKADARKWLDQHLRLEPGTDLRALFRSAIGVPQGLFTTDFLQTPNERKRSFDRLLKVEEYREGAERLRDTVGLINERIAEARGRISGAESQLARYDATVAEHKTARERAEELGASLAAFQREAEVCARAVAELEVAEQRAAEARARAERLEVERDSAQRRLLDLQSNLEAARRAAERQRATHADYRAHLEATEALRSLETKRGERERLRADAADAARMLASAESDVRRLEESLERSRQARAVLVELEKDVATQEELERERERLRDLLARARAAAELLTRLDAELSDLRRAHSETSRRVHAAEHLADAQVRADKLDSERMGVETRLSKVENALTSRKHLATQRRDAAREAERLRRSVTALEREAREFEQAASAAARLPELEEQEHSLTNQAAALRASINQDERASAKAKGGVCPILHEPCKNLAEEGRTFEDFFGQQLKMNRARLATVERDGARVALDVRAARDAEKAAARFETTRARLAHERELLAERESALASVDGELSALAADASESLRDELRAELVGIDGVLKVAREEALRYAELEPLRARLREIEDVGKAKREEREQVAAAASAEAALAEDASKVERRLRELADPRGRAAALRLEAGREAELLRESRGARDALEALQSQSRALDAKLKKFEKLDAQWSDATARRDATADAYREYLESDSLARTLPARESEAKEAEERSARAALDAEAARAEHVRALSLYDRERHGEERGALALARERAAETSAKLEAARERELSLASEVARLEEVRASLGEEFRAKERLEELYAATDFIRDTLRKAGPLVTESYLYNISIEANQLFREITGEGGRALRWSNTYDIILEEGGHERPFVNLSGGEQMVAALSVRLALLKQLSDIRVAFFDEPTVNMDAERRERLAQQIGQVRDFDQLFVISHDDTFEQTVDHVVAIAPAALEEVA
ncbi:MAG TPA: SMC family ATPase [Pyrinomonadaceae bacterium]|jgi:exonuclease SbcC|nr:SMC family ATPase [Pyrinomonadaceae bacterium]